MSFFNAILVTITLAPLAGFGAEVKIQCTLMGPTINWDYMDLVKADFTVDPATIPPKAPKPGQEGCDVRSISSQRVLDTNRFASVRISVWTCHGQATMLNANATFADHELEVLAPLDALGTAAVTSIYSPKENSSNDGIIKTPKGDLTAVWLQCAPPPEVKK